MAGDGIDSVELELACLCGYENFERVVVQRKLNAPIVTDFVACVGCRAMYFAPVLPIAAPTLPPGHGKGIGGPPPGRVLDSSDKLKRDAAEAAKSYAKPGRSGRLKPSGRG